METCLSHVAFLVSSVEASASYLNAKGIATEEPETFDSEGTKEVYVGSYSEQSGLLLLVEGISDGPYKKAMFKRGPSLHHIAVDVLDINTFSMHAEMIGWKLHPISAETLTYKTAWFYLEGVPTLIEAHQKKTLSTKPAKVTKLEIAIQNDQLALFEGIGLGNIVTPNQECFVTVDDQRLRFNQIACLN